MLKIEDSKSDGVAVLKLQGRMDASTAGVLDGKVRELIGAGQKQLVLNLEGLDYISSAGLRDLLRAAKQIQQASGKLALSSLKEQVKEVFEMAGFNTLCQAFPTEDAAIAAVR